MGLSANAAFLWGWKDASVSTSIAQCGDYGISVVAPNSNSTSFGVPPYYMFAWKVNGVPTVSSLGSDLSSLSWKVNHASGSSLVLAVADSTGMTGGVDPFIYSVTDNGAGSSCLPPTPSTTITISPNVSTSDSVGTCEPLGLSMTGGKKPYTVSIAGMNTVLVSNVTLNDGDDVLTWPNRVNPNDQFIVSVSDANGVWGTSTGLFKSSGANITDATECPVKLSSGTSSNLNQHTPSTSNSNASDGTHNKSSLLWIIIIVAVVVVVVGLALLAAVLIYLRRRRLNRLLSRAGRPEPAVLPDAWVGPNTASTGRKSYSRLASDNSGDMEMAPKRPIIQHEDAADIRELPPPYLDRSSYMVSSSSLA